jgi:hypothetical protein
MESRLANEGQAGRRRRGPWRRAWPIIAWVGLVLTAQQAAGEGRFASHPPMRPLPEASNRPLGKGPSFFVDPVNGDDLQEGSEQKPWKTLNRALKQRQGGPLKPGDTLYLRGGTYYENVTVSVHGTPPQPITIRAYPGELAILDAGIREFHEDPANAWEPFSAGAQGEFRSTNSYAYGGGFGNFGDSMVPFHRYLTFADLRSSNELFRPGLSNRADDPTGMYAGPGVRRDPQTGRIHIRLAHTALAGLGDRAYRGETDPRKLPLVISGHDYALRIEGARHVRFQDLVVRGAERSAVLIGEDAEAITQESQDIEFDGVTLYGSGAALRVSRTRDLRLGRCALRGHAAPWHSRFHHKNRAGSGYLVYAAGRDFEFTHCQFTDHHDCIQFYYVEGMQFHHNLVENFNDDGIEPGPKKERGQTFIYQNYIARCQNPFTAHGEKSAPLQHEEGSGVYVFRNIVDLRPGNYKAPPAEPDPSGAFLNHPTEWVSHNHGSPTLPVYYIYHNTFLMQGSAKNAFYAFTWGSHTRGTTRRVFNNIFVQVEGMSGLNVRSLSADDDFQADGNLYWALKKGGSQPSDYFARLRQSALFEASKERYPPGWSAHDQFADPTFVSLNDAEHEPLDLRLRATSPAVNAGVELPVDWPDPLREQDAGKPDVGALPLGVEPFPVTSPRSTPGRSLR